jgi:transcriptional regulator with XRE-family HTH domain
MIKIARINIGFNQKELANKLGLSKSIICQYEKGKKVPRYSHLLEIANVLNLDIQVLVQANAIQYADLFWGKLKGEKHEMAYFPRYKGGNDLDKFPYGLMKEDFAPFINICFSEGYYLWFSPEHPDHSNGEAAYLVQKAESVSERDQIVYTDRPVTGVYIGQVINKTEISTRIGGTTKFLNLDEITLIGRIVHVALNL